MHQLCFRINKYRQFKKTCEFVVQDDDYVFTAWDSMELIDLDRYSRKFKDFIKRIEIQKNVPLKNLRHINISFLLLEIVI